MLGYAFNALSFIANFGPSLYYCKALYNTVFGPSDVVFSSPNTSNVNNLFPELQKVKNLRNDIQLYNSDEINYAFALGTSFTSHALIVGERQLLNTKGDAKNLILKHEISHIHHNDAFYANSLAAIVALISIVFARTMKSLLPWWASPIVYMIPTWSGITTYQFINKFAEERADNFAIEHATDQELQDMKLFIEAFIEVNKLLFKKSYQGVTEDGNLHRIHSIVSGQFHPHLTERLELLKKALKDREVADIKDNEKFESYISYHKNVMTRLTKISLDK